MAAGAGFKTFNTGDVLSAADVNTYLMQGIWVFANATARDAAVTSPQEGNACYLKDTDVIQVYTGSTWAAQSASNPISGNIVDAKGDIIAATAADTVSRLAVGANDTVLTADSSTATGLKWSTPASGGMTLINTGGTTLTGASVTISSIPTTYVNLFLIVRNARPATDGAYLQMRFNGVSTNSYAEEISTQANGSFNNNTIAWGDQFDNGAQTSIAWFNIYDYANTTAWKPVLLAGFGVSNLNTANWGSRLGNALFNGTSAITSITLLPNTGNWTSGEAYLYGVK